MTPEELKKYVCLNDRIFPNNWGDYLKILEIRSGHPCTPLILGGSECSDEEKRERLLLQIDFASNNKNIYEKLKNNILSLKESDWVHKGEF